MASKAGKKVRCGIVGAGWIAQAWMMPNVEHTGNSTITAIVTGDAQKAKKLAQKYGVKNTYGYSEYNKMLKSGDVDAVYIATPNWRHAEFAVPALKAGIHVLLEKPMEVSEKQCRKILDAAKKSKGKLMIAYRLHFEPATVHAIERVRSGELGEVQFFSSSFAQHVAPSNSRAKNGWDAGPVLDMGPYPLNAVRNLFSAEPEEVFAFGTRHREAGFKNFDDTVCVTMKFSKNRLAQWTVSYNGNDTNSYFVVGTKGTMEVQPAFMFGGPLKVKTSKEGKDTEQTFPETDHFGGEMKHFSECILMGHEPEPSGLEGLADVRIIDAIKRALKTGKAQKLAPFDRKGKVSARHVQKLTPKKPPAQLVNASKPEEG